MKKIILVQILILILRRTQGEHRSHYTRRSDGTGLPMKKDFPAYLSAIKRAIEFTVSHKNVLDSNYEFGVFLLNVHLKKVLSEKYDTLPESIRTDISELTETVTGLNQYFHHMVLNNKQVKFETPRKITTLFLNDTTWFKRLPKLKVNSLASIKLQTSYVLKIKYSTWDVYMDNIKNYGKFMPYPELADDCEASLSLNKEASSNITYQCSLPAVCKEYLSVGSNFGYALTHRLLLIVSAHYGRGCYIMSPKLDQEAMDVYCTEAYGEGQFIAANGYQVEDLLMEQVALCSLAGHAKFLKREWMEKLLTFQSHFGCFKPGLEVSDVAVNVQHNVGPWEVERHDFTLMSGVCNGHITSVAVAALSAAARFILENYY